MQEIPGRTPAVKNAWKNPRIIEISGITSMKIPDRTCVEILREKTETIYEIIKLSDKVSIRISGLEKENRY